MERIPTLPQNQISYNRLSTTCHIGRLREATRGNLRRVEQLYFTSASKLPDILTIQICRDGSIRITGSFGYSLIPIFSSHRASALRHEYPEETQILDQFRTLEMGIAANRRSRGNIISCDYGHWWHSLAVKKCEWRTWNEFDGSDHQYFHPGEKGLSRGSGFKAFDYANSSANNSFFPISAIVEDFIFDGSDLMESPLWYTINSRPHFLWRCRSVLWWGRDEDAVLYLQLANTFDLAGNPNANSIAGRKSVACGRALSKGSVMEGIGFDYRLAMEFLILDLKTLKHKQWWTMGPFWSSAWNWPNRPKNRKKSIAYAREPCNQGFWWW